jgi:hypothetical protein
MPPVSARKHLGTVVTVVEWVSRRATWKPTTVEKDGRYAGKRPYRSKTYSQNATVGSIAKSLIPAMPPETVAGPNHALWAARPRWMPWAPNFRSTTASTAAHIDGS